MAKNGCKCGCGDTRLKCDCDVIHEDRVEYVKKHIADDEILLLLSDFYKALSDSTRVKIISALEKQEMCVCDLAALFNMTKSAVSHQLKNLREMELIKSRREGKIVFYSLADDHVKQVFDISLEHVKEALK